MFKIWHINDLFLGFRYDLQIYCVYDQKNQKLDDLLSANNEKTLYKHL